MHPNKGPRFWGPFLMLLSMFISFSMPFSEVVKEQLPLRTHVGPPVEELVLRDRLEAVRRPRQVVGEVAVGDLVAGEARGARGP